MNLLSEIVSVAFHGVAYGMILYVISVGLSITLGLMGFVNLAHGVFAMAGGYILSTLLARTAVPFPLALAVVFLGVAAVSVVLERALYSRFYNAGELAQVLFSIGLMFIAVALARRIYGSLQQTIALPSYLQGQFALFGREFVAYRTFVIAIGGALAAVLWFGIERTRFGAIVRASVDNGPMAQSIGINTKKVFALTFVLGSGLAGLGGALGADLLLVQPTYPFEYLVYFLMVVSLGGIGRLSGPLLAALLIGIGDTACKYWFPEFGAFFVYVAAIVILLLRPQGLVGVRT
jgi:branched-chain amino acid transport system permease protein